MSTTTTTTNVATYTSPGGTLTIGTSAHEGSNPRIWLNWLPTGSPRLQRVLVYPDQLDGLEKAIEALRAELATAGRRGKRRAHTTPSRPSNGHSETTPQ